MARGHQIARLAPSRRSRFNPISWITLWSSRNPVIVLGTVFIVTLMLGAGIPLISTDVDVTDVLPQDNPHTLAAQNVTREFKSAYTQQGSITFYTNPIAWHNDNERLVHRNQAVIDNYDLGPHNITDEVYLRASEEFFQYVVRASGGTIQAGVGVPGFYKLINWTVAGGQDAPDEAYSLPPYESRTGALQYEAVHVLVRATIGDDLVDAVVSPKYDTHTLLLLVDPHEPMSSREIGRVFMEAREEYNQAAERGELEWTVFGPDNPPLFIVDNPVANAHGSQLTEEDLLRLMPLVLVFLFIVLYVAFRNVKSVLISGASLLTSVIWTYGVMGYMGIPLNTLNLVVIPLIMGVGIDYSVHMINEFLEHKSAGLSDQAAFKEVGYRAAFAMFIATVTTATGLAVMTASPSVLMAQLGFLSAVGILSTYLLTITFIPAALTLVRNTAAMGADFRPSKFMPAWGANVSRHRAVWTIAVLAVTVILVVNMANLQKEAFGDPGSNFPEDDPVRREHELSLQRFYSEPEPAFKTNILVLEGDVTHPDTHDYIREISRNLETKASVNPDTLRSIVIGIESWMQIREGGASAVHAISFEALRDATGIDQFDTYPQTQQEIEAALVEIWDSPFREAASLFINHPEDSITTMTFAVTSKDFIDAEEAWHDVMEAVRESEHMRPDGVTVAFVGNTATNFLFIEEQLPWLTYMSIVASMVGVALVALFTRELRPTLTVAALMFLTTVWFLGVLPWFGIGLAITLMLPMVFIFNIGTDYAVHLVWNMRQLGDPWKVYANVGKAIFFSAITTMGAFAFFIPIRNVAMSRTMIATLVAIGVIFLVTVVVTALAYRVKAPEKSEAADRSEGGTGVDRMVPLELEPRGTVAPAHNPGPAPGSRQGGFKGPTQPPQRTER